MNVETKSEQNPSGKFPIQIIEENREESVFTMVFFSSVLGISNLALWQFFGKELGFWTAIGWSLLIAILASSYRFVEYLYVMILLATIVLWAAGYPPLFPRETPQ